MNMKIQTAIVWSILAATLLGDSHQVSAAMTFRVKPGQSIQAAIDKAVSGDKIVIYGKPGYTYREYLTLKPSLILSGVDNPVLSPCLGAETICRSIELRNRVQLIKLTITGIARPALYNPERSDFFLVMFPVDASNAEVRDCLVLGRVAMLGSSNKLINSIVRLRGTILDIEGGGNLVQGNVLHSESSEYSGYATGGDPVSIAYGPLTSLLPKGSNRLTHNTIIAWGSVPYLYSVMYSRGINVGKSAGFRNTIDHCIIANSGGKDIQVEYGGTPVSVSYTLLQNGTNDPNVRLITGIQQHVQPQFVNASVRDFRLLSTSPAIDAGDPTRGIEPDGTVQDLGAISFDQKLTRRLLFY